MSSSNKGLKSSNAFNALERTIGDFNITDIADRSIVSLAFSPACRETVNSLCMTILETALPAVGGVSHSSDSLTLLGLQQDQIWCLQPHKDNGGVKALQARLGHSNTVYLTDQSDGWATLKLDGGNVLAVLERLCISDLGTRQFPVDTVSRTVIDHIGTVMCRTSEQSFELMVPRSFASSILHAIENIAVHIDYEQR